MNAGGVDVELRLAAIAETAPEPIQEHWVEVHGKRYPPKQVYQLFSGRPRATFTSHRALSHLRALGLETSVYIAKPKAASRDAGIDVSPETGDESAESFAKLAAFLSSNMLTSHLARAESALAGSDAAATAGVIADFDFSEDLLDAALSVRRHVGRLSDVIHAATITRCLPLILEEGEIITTRPSLGAGNDPTRPYDLETDRRIAEFKVAQWKGGDTMRKRGVFADLVHLALDESTRKAQIFVVGSRPVKFLRTSTTTAQWALARSSPHLRTRFDAAFGTDVMTVAEFTNGPGKEIEIVDLSELLSALAER